MGIIHQCSAQVFKRAWCHLKRAHLVRWTDRQKGTISAVNWRKRTQLAWWKKTGKRALLTRWTDKKRGTPQSMLCVDNKNDKTAKSHVWLTLKKKIVKKAWRHFSFLKRAGRHQKGAGRRALQKRPRQNTVHACIFENWPKHSTLRSSPITRTWSS